MDKNKLIKKICYARNKLVSLCATLPDAEVVIDTEYEDIGPKVDEVIAYLDRLLDELGAKK